MLLRDFELLIKWNQVIITGIFNINTVIQKTHKGRRNKGLFQRNKLIKKIFFLKKYPACLKQLGS